jgi:OFA family oxalate/formate antiporter-like MFS transporter
LSDSKSPRKRSKIFFGWYVVTACVIITLYTGGVVNFGFTAVFDPLAKEFGWSYAQISLASSLRGLEVGLLSAVVGLLVDRLGPRKLILGGTVLIFLGYLVLSGVSSLPMFYAAFALIALGMSACTGTVLLTAVTHWFSRRAGIATGIVASGFGLGGTIVPGCS